MPALLTSTEIGPSAFSVLETNPATSFAFVTSVVREKDGAPSFSISARTEASAASSLPQIATEAPRVANLMAMARPMPRLAPVTKAVMCFKGCGISAGTLRSFTVAMSDPFVDGGPLFSRQTHLIIETPAHFCFQEVAVRRRPSGRQRKNESQINEILYFNGFFSLSRFFSHSIA